MPPSRWRGQNTEASEQPRTFDPPPGLRTASRSICRMLSFTGTTGTALPCASACASSAEWSRPKGMAGRHRGCQQRRCRARWPSRPRRSGTVLPLQDHMGGAGAAVFGLELRELFKQAFVQDQGDLASGRALETAEGPPHQWQTLHIQKLLRRRQTHAGACAPGHHDDVVLHRCVTNQPLKRAPTAFQSTTLKNALM